MSHVVEDVGGDPAPITSNIYTSTLPFVRVVIPPSTFVSPVERTREWPTRPFTARQTSILAGHSHDRGERRLEDVRL